MRRILLLLMFVLCASLVNASFHDLIPGGYCGDGYCDLSADAGLEEDCAICPDDCGLCIPTPPPQTGCRPGECSAGETCQNYEPPTTSDSECWVTVYNFEQPQNNPLYDGPIYDFTTPYGSMYTSSGGIRTALENSDPGDPPQSCDPAGDFSDCPTDFEDPQSCTPFIGTGGTCIAHGEDYYCEASQTTTPEVLGTCVADPTPPCGDGTCAANEDCSTCAADCGCSDPTPFCDTSGTPTCAQCPTGQYCQKRSINDTIEGNCPIHTQCYYGLNSGFTDDCVDNGYFDVSIQDQEDIYCFGGKWSTRTRIVAEKLLDIANDQGGDFSIFCDEKQKSLIFGDSSFGPDYDDAQPTGDHERYCVLLLGDADNVNGIVVGAAVYDIDAYLPELGQAHGAAHDMGPLDVTGNTCNAAINFTECFSHIDSADSKKNLYVYADTTYDLILFTQDSSAVEGSWTDRVASFFQNILGASTETPRLTSFDRLYINQKTNGDAVTAVYQTLYSDADSDYDNYLTVEYTSITGVISELQNNIPAEEANVVSGNVLILKNPNPGAWNLLSGRTRLN